MNAYRGWDVHSYTQDVKARLGEIREVLCKKYHPPWSCRTPFNDDLFYKCLDWCSRNLERSKVDSCLSKFKNYWLQTDGGWVDRDLENVNVAWLFTCSVHCCATLKDDSVCRLFQETLEDIGTTCVQGDSHRLLCFLVGATEFYK